ncbi:MAG: ATP-binding cassette domain-containing protein, partial [Candidatus Taylorbacteria bacterium]|nr:ATP-binding cassette domain-containing protein [Candidatus Taylorbacteria bacterium]
ESLPLINILVAYEKEVDKNREFAGGNKQFVFNKILEFKNVSFGYIGGQNIVSSLNLSINKGEMVGLIGPSGAGKTTMVDLLLRLFRPQNGKLLIDGANIDEIDKKSWHDNIGYVSQDIFLINDTIENNVRFYNDSLNHKDIADATKSANIYDFIEALPDKFQTLVGERGVQLSGGQRQRIVLARILARKPSVLVLDEATSALDNESEHKIQEAIRNLRGKLTILIVAHRLSTVMHADKIAVIKNGVISEEGSPEELLNNTKSYFYKNYNLEKEIT